MLDKRNSLRAGDTVLLNSWGGSVPRYLVGANGIVRGFVGDRVRVEFPTYGVVKHVPADQLRRVLADRQERMGRV